VKKIGNCPLLGIEPRSEDMHDQLSMLLNQPYRCTPCYWWSHQSLPTFIFTGTNIGISVLGVIFNSWVRKQHPPFSGSHPLSPPSTNTHVETRSRRPSSHVHIRVRRHWIPDTVNSVPLHVLAALASISSTILCHIFVISGRHIRTLCQHMTTFWKGTTYFES